MARGKYKRKRERKLAQAVSVASLGFPTRLEKILLQAGLNTLADLTSLSGIQLKALPGLGDASYAVICEKCKERGVVLRADNPPQG